MNNLKKLIKHILLWVGFGCILISVVRWSILTHIKLGLETEFYQTAIEHMKKDKNVNQ